MSNTIAFNEVKEKYAATLEQYVPVVSRVHGDTHPEFYGVHKMYDAIVAKIKEAGSTKPDLNEEFGQLREMTSDYIIPQGVCETYEAVYNMLAELDKAYHA